MSKDIRHLVGENARRLRRAIGITQAELSAKMDRDRAYVSGLELGRRNPTILTLCHLAQALGVHPRGFFEEGQSQDPEKQGPKTHSNGPRAGVRGQGGAKASRSKKGARAF